MFTSSRPFFLQSPILINISLFCLTLLWEVVCRAGGLGTTRKGLKLEEVVGRGSQEGGWERTWCCREQRQEETPFSEGLCRAVGGMHRGQEGEEVVPGQGF